MPYAKNHVTVKVPRRSGFDKSHRNSGTLTCGTLTPLLCDEVVPGSRVSLKLNLATQLPPLVSDTYMNLKLKAEAFFCPSRLCCASFEDFFCDFPRRVFTLDDASIGQNYGTFSDVKAAVPVISLYSDTPSAWYGPGSLLDFLGFKVNTIPEASPGVVTLGYTINAMPLIAYHLIWQEWYRNPRVQNPAFAPSLGLSPNYQLSHTNVANWPYTYFHRSFTADGGSTSPDNSVRDVHDAASYTSLLSCADGHLIFNLRQRNFGLDYFTGSRPDAQQGSPAAVSFQVDGSGNGDITIAAIRAMNSLQQFRERNNLPSPRLVDQVKARYNANLADGVAQRPICIGSASYDVDSTGVNQTAPDNSSPRLNPFSGVAAQYGRAYASGSDFIIKDFTANEPGYIMVLVSLVPEVTYSSGVSPLFRRYRVDGSITDMACSILQNVGDQPIYGNELLDRSGTASPNVFGYQDRYSDWMFKPNEAHGLFRDGQSLDSFVLQRSFSSYVTLGSSFLEIPKNYLYPVVAAPISGIDAWYDCLLDYKVSMPLAEFSIPSLQDPAYEHGESVSLRRNGQIF